jgi:dihydrofolate synthase / folylpolyglutamate synthase
VRFTDDLLARSALGMRAGLGAMRAAMAALGHPERRTPVIHIAGTNGKGSTAAFVEAMARSAGRRTLTYTSPHLSRLNERIRVDGAPIDDDALAAALAPALAVAPPLTFFEAMTAAAFLASAEVDLAIVEVGLGGRLDATNVVESPIATGIVSIAKDHVKILGDTLALIAGEKAGIVKPGAPVVIGPMAAEAREAIVARAREVGAGEVIVVGSDVSWHGDELVGRVEARAEHLALGGAHQRDNAAVAAALAACVGLDRAAIEAGLAGASWPGRLERFTRGGVEVVLDCAHNPHGAAALARALPWVPERTLLVFGAMGDKGYLEMLDVLAPLATRRFYATPTLELPGRHPAPPAELAARHAGAIAGEGPAAIDRALAEAAPGDTLLVCGSIFLVGAVRAHLMGERLDRVLGP